MKILLNIFKAIWGIILFIVFIALIVGWLNYFIVSKTKAKMLIEDIGTYVEVNNVQINEEWLKDFVLREMKAGFIKEGDYVSIDYSQYASDKRFEVQVYYSSSYSLKEAIYTYKGISYADAPTESLIFYANTITLKKEITETGKS